MTAPNPYHDIMAGARTTNSTTPGHCAERRNEHHWRRSNAAKAVRPGREAGVDLIALRDQLWPQETPLQVRTAASPAETPSSIRIALAPETG